MNHPLVSVVLTTCGRTEKALKAFHSLKEQTCRDIEIVVVDDNPEGKDSLILDTHEGDMPRVRLIRHPGNRGLSAARNSGIRAAHGKHVVFLDDDDELKPESIQTRLSLWNSLGQEARKRIGVVYHGCEVHVVDERRTWNNMPKIRGSIKNYILEHGPKTIQSTCMFPRAVLEHVGGFDENLKSFIDHDIWLKLAFEDYEAVALNEALTVSYVSKRHVSMISDVSSRLSAIETFLEKWAVPLSRSIGKKKTDTWIAAYRSKVLSSLCARKLFSGCATDAFVVFSHILSRSKLHPVGVGYAVFFLGRSILRYTLPGFVANKFQH